MWGDVGKRLFQYQVLRPIPFLILFFFLFFFFSFFPDHPDYPKLGQALETCQAMATKINEWLVEKSQNI